MLSNSPGIASELAKTVSVEDRHANTPRELSIIEISHGRENEVHEMDENRPKLCVDDRHVNAPRSSSIMEITTGPPKLSNSARNGPKSAQTAIVDDRHVRATWGSTTMEIASGPQNSE